MMSAYAVVLLVFGIVLSYLWLIHNFGCAGFREEHKPRSATGGIVILGGGFGGLHPALHFRRQATVRDRGSSAVRTSPSRQCCMGGRGRLDVRHRFAIAEDAQTRALP
jgi:hypothetical protein